MHYSANWMPPCLLQVLTAEGDVAEGLRQVQLKCLAQWRESAAGAFAMTRQNRSPSCAGYQ
jgi:hypothetical protein